MTQEEILQYNKRCADFMGLKISIKLEDGYDCGTWYKPTDNENEYLLCPVMYHSDWNWIMEVVEAIENKLNDSFNVDIVNKNQCEIVRNGEEFICGAGFNTINHYKKEAVVEAINQFLIWHEQNKTIPKIF